MELLDCVVITPEQADNFAPLIPAPVLKELREETALGLGSLLGDVPNGAAVFRVENHAAQILSLYVDRYDRKNGTGRFLMEKLCAALRGVSGVYSVRAPLPEGDDGAAAFFERLGARLETLEGGEYRFPLSALEKSPLRKAPRSPHCLAGDKLDRSILAYFQRDLEKKGDYLMEQNLLDPSVRQDLSWYYVKDTEMLGCAVMRETERGLTLAQLTNDGGIDVLPVLLGTLVRDLLETCPPETEISLEAVVPETRTLLKRIAPTAEKSTRRAAVLAL